MCVCECVCCFHCKVGQLKFAHSQFIKFFEDVLYFFELQSGDGTSGLRFFNPTALGCKSFNLSHLNCVDLILI